MFKTPRGMVDLLPDDTRRWRAMESKLRKVLACYAYEEIRTPVLEETELFARSVGATTDIVEKEMFSFTDKGGTSLTLRPEATASIVRSYLEHHLGHGQPLAKLYFIGPMFRHERPQKGRFRQFHQVNVEAIGSDQPLVDVEILTLAMEMLDRFDVKDPKLEINSLGDEECRPDYRKTLLVYLRDRKDQLCENCRRRLDVNPLRCFDCKSETCRGVMEEAPLCVDYLCRPCKTHFTRVQEGLKATGIPFTLNPHIVRGLDYYSRTAFEVTSNALGAQNAVSGGGRYDYLAETLGGSRTPAIGFAMGLERLQLIATLPAEGSGRKRIDFVPLSEECESETLTQSLALRREAISHNLPVTVDVSPSGSSVKAALRRANKQGAQFVVLIGPDELKKKTAVVKSLAGQGQEEVPFAQLTQTLRERLA